MAVLEEYLWIPICCSVVAFFSAFGIGIFVDLMGNP